MAKKKKDEIESNGPAEPTALELELAKLPSTDKAAVIMLLLDERRELIERRYKWGVS